MSGSGLPPPPPRPAMQGDAYPGQLSLFGSQPVSTGAPSLSSSSPSPYRVGMVHRQAPPTRGLSNQYPNPEAAFNSAPAPAATTPPPPSAPSQAAPGPTPSFHQLAPPPRGGGSFVAKSIPNGKGNAGGPPPPPPPSTAGPPPPPSAVDRPGQPPSAAQASASPFSRGMAPRYAAPAFHTDTVPLSAAALSSVPSHQELPPPASEPQTHSRGGSYFSSSPVTATVPPLTTRVSSAVLRPASSRGSSRTGWSPREAGSNTSTPHRPPSRGAAPPPMTETPNSSRAAPPQPKQDLINCQSSGGQSFSPSGNAAAVESSERGTIVPGDGNASGLTSRTSSQQRQVLRRDIPSFLQPNQRLSQPRSTTGASLRGRELLEAALLNRASYSTRKLSTMRDASISLPLSRHSTPSKLLFGQSTPTAGRPSDIPSFSADSGGLTTSVDHPSTRQASVPQPPPQSQPKGEASPAPSAPPEAEASAVAQTSTSVGAFDLRSGSRSNYSNIDLTHGLSSLSCVATRQENLALFMPTEQDTAAGEILQEGKDGPTVDPVPEPEAATPQLPQELQNVSLGDKAGLGDRGSGSYNTQTAPSATGPTASYGSDAMQVDPVKSGFIDAVTAPSTSSAHAAAASNPFLTIEDAPIIDSPESMPIHTRVDAGSAPAVVPSVTDGRNPFSSSGTKTGLGHANTQESGVEQPGALHNPCKDDWWATQQKETGLGPRHVLPHPSTSSLHNSNKMEPFSGSGTMGAHAANDFKRPHHSDPAGGGIAARGSSPFLHIANTTALSPPALHAQCPGVNRYGAGGPQDHSTNATLHQLSNVDSISQQFSLTHGADAAAPPPKQTFQDRDNASGGDSDFFDAMGTPSPRDQLSVVSPFANANENRNGNPGMARGGEFSPTPQPPENMQNASKCPTPTLTYVTKMDASKLQVTPPTFLEEGDLVDVKNVGGWDTQKEMKSFSVLDVSDAHRNSVESPAQLAANMTKEDFLPVTENVEREPGQRRFVALQQLPSRSESSSSKNPFLDVTEENVNNSHGDAPNNSAPQQAILASSFVSAAASPFGQSLIGSSAQERGGVSSGCSPGLGAGLLAEERSGSPSSTSGGATLVNPFSKIAGNSILAARSRSGSFSTPSAYIGMSTTPLGAGGSTSASVRAPGSGPSFAIFVGGTALGNAQCIAGCFHHSTALSHQSSVLTPSLQRAPAVTAMSQRNLKDSMSSSFLMKYNRDRATCDPTNTASTLSFITLEEALTNSCTLVDRKGVRGTQLGRAYVKAVREGVFLSATRVASWMADPDWPQIEQAFAALGPSVPAPLVDVLQLIFSDAMDPVGKGFLWKEKGRSCLADLFNTASAAAERSGGGHPSPSSYTPADSDTASLQLKAKEGSAGLRKIEDLLCAGSREEAVETALQHGLYAHALLISMMCPTKDFYIRSVKAIIEKELVPTSPLSHAYAMFNEMPLPPLLSQSQPSPSPEMELGSSQLTSVNASSARLLSAEERNNLRHTWRRHAAVLLANFTRSSGEGLLQLADALQRIGLLMEAHTCVLALHLTPLGMAAAVRASEKRQQPLSVSGGSSASLALPRPEQSFVMKEIRNRLGVVGGAYHPMEGCRTSFLTPVTTALSMLLHAAQVKLDERAPPRPEVDDGPLIAFHGLPQSSPRYSVAYHLMQVLWMRELGLQKEAEEAMSALLNKMPAPVAFSMQAPPRTLNELVFLFGAVRPEREATALPPQVLPGNGPSSAAIPPPGPAPREQSSDSPLPPNRPSSQSSPPMHQLSPDGPPVAAALAKEPAMALQPIKEPPTKQRVSSPEEKLLPPPPPLSESSTTRPPLSSQQRAAALQPPPPSASSGPTHGSDAQAGADTRKSTSKPAPSKRSSSVDALRNFFFRRGRSEDVEGDGKAHKLEEAKPMILNTEKPPQFDSATGRWLFEETEEEKAQQEMVKKGPPKIGPRLTSTTNSGGTVPAVGPPSAPVPLNNGGGAAHPSPTGPRVAANNGGPKGPPGPGGMQRPGKRPQYVDMFNSM